MLHAEHEAAEILRHKRLKAYALRQRGGLHLGWLIGLLGFSPAR